MYERTTSSTTYAIPQCCCSCLGPAEKRLMIVQAREWTEEGVKYRQSYDIDVPICSSCKRAVYKRRLLGFAIFFASAAAAWIVGNQDLNEWEIWLAILIVIAGLITLGYFWFSRLPADITDSGVPTFQNATYQRMFSELNRMPVPEHSHPEVVEPNRREISSDLQEPKPVKAEVLFAFDDEISILRFPVGAERRYARHVKLLEHMIDARVLPAVKICGLEAGSNASCARIIVITSPAGSMQHVVTAYSTDAAGAFVERECGGDWGLVNAESTVSNVAEPGLAVGDLGRFNELCQEIEGGAYRFDRLIS